MSPQLPHRRFQGNPGKPTQMFFLSLLLHAIVLLVMIVSLPTPTRTLTFGGPYAVSLVGPEALLPNRSATLPSLPVGPSSSIASIAKQEIPSTPQTTRIRKDDTPQSAIERAIDTIRQKQQHAGAETQSPSSQRPPGEAGMADSVLAEYSAFVQSRIKNNWSLPDTLRPQTPVLTIIAIRITPDGRLESIGFEKRSGNAYYDDSALRAVQKSAPFPPFPDAYRRATMDIGVRFPSSELQ